MSRLSPAADPLVLSLLLASVLAAACSRAPAPGTPGAAEAEAVGETEERGGAAVAIVDPHSAARPGEVAVEHLDLDLTVDFESRTLAGRASLGLDRASDAGTLRLDTRGLEIERVRLEEAPDRRGRRGEPREAVWELGPEEPFLGRALVIELTPETETVHVDYRTTPGAAALQWLTPEQTATGHPFLFTQSQAILARTWIPLQDTPAVRFTYDATVRVPPELLAVMSAENPTAKTADGVYRFEMPQPVPSYLMALAVGDLEFRSLGPTSGVYAEPPIVEEAAWEFADTERMIEAAERLYGPYRWGRYDILVLPPSFPFGGMENPRLTFATPTILAGDRSLVALIAHELAHSWSGNLVTNATWNDFWLNEGFTVYFERRIMEEILGRPYAEMLAALGLQDLETTFEELGRDADDTHLHLALAGRDPDEGMTDVAYEKGYFLLRTLEETIGRERFDAFLRDYFDRFAFQSMDTGGFVAVVHEDLLTEAEAEALDLEAWIYGPGLPPNADEPRSTAFDAVELQLRAWRGGTPASRLATAGWTTHEWLHFLRNLPDDLDAEQMAELDRAFGFTESGNSEILAAWLGEAIEHDYEAAYPALERFLTSMGRRKFLKPLYQALAETPEGLERAREIYERARPTYHSISTGTIDEILDWEE